MLSGLLIINVINYSTSNTTNNAYNGSYTTPMPPDQIVCKQKIPTMASGFINEI
jgi:hypothetical protein